MTDLPPPLRETNWHARLRRLGDALGALVSRAWLRRAAGLTVRVQLTETELTRALQTGSTSASDVIQRAAAMVTAAGGQFTDELAELARLGVIDGVSLGIEAARGMIGAQDGAVLLNFRSPTAEMLRQLERIVEREAFKASVARFGADIGGKAGDLLLYGLAQGYNPRRIASILSNYIVSVPKVWAETTARTAQLYAYRRATHETYRANADVVTGWMWWSARDVRTCFPAGTLVTTQNGLRNIEDVRRGDYVLGNSGKFRKVYDTMRRNYDGKAVTLRVGKTTVTMTADHLVLVDRGGERCWITAERCEVGDVVFIDPQYLASDRNHARRDVAIERGIRDAHNAITGGNETSGFANVSIGPAMPIYTVDFNGKVAGGDIEVRWIARQTGFLLERFTKYLQTISKVALRFGFAGIAPIAGRPAKLLMRLRGHNSKLLAAGQTGVNHGWATARLAAIPAIIFSGAERLSTTFALAVKRVGRSTRLAANTVTGGVGLSNGEFFAADRARLGDSVTSGCAIATAKTTGPGTLELDRLTAVFAPSCDAFVLNSGIALGTAILPSTFSDPSGRNAELFPTVVADSFDHAVIVSKTAHHIQCDVYDLSVENDHTFVANGLLVHNCLSCLSLHGEVFPLSEELNDHHRGRCAALPIVRGSTWPNDVQRGAEWFAGLDAVRQREMMGPGMFAAYQAGGVDWSRMSVTYQNDVYGPMRRQATLRELGIVRVR